MNLSTFLFRSRKSPSRVHRPRRLQKATRPQLEVLEDRTLPSIQFTPGPLIAAGNRPDTALGDISGFRPVEPYISVSDSNPGNIAVSQQAGMRVSASDGANGTFSGVTGFPGSNGGDTATTYTSDGRLFWVNIASPGLAIQEINPTTGVAIGPSHAVDNLGGADDKPFVAADPTAPGSLYVVWTAFLSQTEVLVRHSTDWGSTWSAAVRVDSGSDGFVWPATVTVDTSHFVYVAYHSVLNFTGSNPSNGDGAVFVTRYNSDLTAPLHTTPVARGFADITYNVQTAPQNRVIPGAQFWIQGAGQPWILADPARPGNIYVISADSNNFSNDFGDIRITRSTNSGASWSSPTLISGGAGHTEFFPNAAIDRFGDIVVAWYDNRRGLLNASGRYKLDVFAKYSTDGGLTFSSDFAVNDQTVNVNTPNGNVFDPDVGAVQRFSGPPPTTRIGEYFGLAVWGGTAYVAWNGNSFSGFNNPVGEQVWTKAFAIRGALTVTGTPGDDTITIRNMPTGSQGSDFFEVLVNGQQQYAGLWSALTSITVIGTSGNDTVNIEDSAFGVPIAVNEGNGTDTVNVSPTAKFLDHIKGDLNIGSGSGVDTLNVFDQNDGFNGDTYTLAANSVTRNASALISYAGQNFVNINGGSGNDFYNVNGTEVSFATTLDTGPGQDTVNVRGTGSGSTFTVTATTGSGGSGLDVVNVGNANSLAGILGPVLIENEKSVDTVNINDQADTTFENTATIATVIQKGSTVGRLSGLVGVAPISWDYPDTAAVTINTGSGGARVTVLGTGVPTFINGNTLGTNTLVGANLETTWNVTGANAGNFSNALASATFTGFQNLTGGSGNDGFVFSNGATLSGTLNGGGGGNGLSLSAYTTNLTVNITGAGAGNIPGVVFAFLNISGVSTGSGNDIFNFSNGATMGSIDGGGGTNTLNAAAYTSSRFVLIDGTNSGGILNVVGFANIQNVILGSGNDTFVFSDGGSLAGTLDGGGGTNTIDATGQTTGRTYSITTANGGSVAGMLGAFTNFRNIIGAGAGGNVFAFFNGGSLAGELDGGVGPNNLLDYAAYTTPVTVNLSTTSATGVGVRVVDIQQLRGGTSNDSLTGNGAGGTTFFAGPGTDTVTGLGSGNTLIGTNLDSTWNVTSSNAGTLTFATGTTTFSGVQNLAGGSGADNFVFADGATVSGSINGDGGNNTLNTSAYTSNESFSVNAANGGSATVVPAFSSIQNLIGGGGNNTFAIGSAGSLAGSLNGGSGGTNTLDYSAYTANVLVDLQTGQATATGGVSNILNVNGANSGGAGLYNLLIGNGGNVLTGGSGRRNILVAGGTASTLLGGNQDDLLIGGTTIYDTQAGLASWQAIAAYWAGSDPYNTRVNNLTTGNGVPLLDATTVTGNGGSNTMTGTGELALIYTDGADTISGFDPGSQTVTITP